MFIEPPHIINITSDVLINISALNNVNLNCSFAGDLTYTTAYWIKGNMNLTRNTTIMSNNTAVLSLSIDPSEETYLGSYQCVVTNEVGYDSRTTRVLPTGNTHVDIGFIIYIVYI